MSSARFSADKIRVDLSVRVAVVGAPGKVPLWVVESCTDDYWVIEAGHIDKPVTICTLMTDQESAKIVMMSSVVRGAGGAFQSPVTMRRSLLEVWLIALWTPCRKYRSSHHLCREVGA